MKGRSILGAVYLISVFTVHTVQAATCSSVRLNVNVPSIVKPTRAFRAKFKVTNTNRNVATGLALTVTLPIEFTLFKASPAPSNTLNPWSLVYGDITLGPLKSMHVVVRGLVGECFQGSMTFNATVAVPADNTCATVTAARTLSIKDRTGTKRPPYCMTNTSQLNVDCGVPLPTFSVEPFPVGTCGSIPASDPRAFGPDAWQMLHIFAQNYPEDPQPQVAQACESFINALPYMLPCEVCGYTFGEFILANIEHADTFSPACQASQDLNMPCQTPAQACATQSALVNFFLRAHHSVDQRTQPCKSLWTPAMAAEAYAYQPDFCATCIVWGTVPLCKSVGETDCQAVNTTEPCGTVAPYLAPTPAPLTASPTPSSELIVECGIVLPPSISDWPMGQCGNRTTGDPRVFGPYTWRTVHRFAQFYPIDPTTEVQEACVNFINALPFLLPCPHCGHDFVNFIVANLENAGTFNAACAANVTYGMPCESLEQACATRPNLVSFFLRAHHNVDRNNKPCKPLWSLEEAVDAFAVMTNFCATDGVSAGYELCRGKDESACEELATTPPCGYLVPFP